MLRRIIVPCFLALVVVSCETMETEEKKAEAEEKKLVAMAEPYLNACKNELQKLCKSAGNDKEKQADCLKKNKSQAEANCRNAIEKSGK